ncbi:MAG: AmmeMemoRadiSam system radical SAM enzyme [Spirochaetes bacterium]|nr:AmmeMemoRadiSam system radical SAM enzyme [Spirochaetota bacterium]
MKAGFFTKLNDNRVRCELCPHRCTINPGRYGICRVRNNDEGDLKIPFYGRISSYASDPVEKKPLYHFYPGRSIVSVGFVGCSLRCPFCQNYTISTRTDTPTEYLSPDELVNAALREHSLGIAYTYSEPLVHFEYVVDTAKKAHEKGLKNVLVSNGYINEEPADELLNFIDAANIDLKTFNPDFYRKELGGNLEDIKRFIKQAAGRIELEVTTLVIPGRNDSSGEIESIVKFLAGINPDIPYHLSCYYPTYKYTVPPTPPSLVKKLAEVSKKYLNYVYLGNVGLLETNTYCPECRNLLVRRRGYSVSVPGLTNGVCKKCGIKIPIVM